MNIEIDIRETASGKMLILRAKEGDYEFCSPFFRLEAYLLEEFKIQAIKAIKKMRS